MCTVHCALFTVYCKLCTMHSALQCLLFLTVTPWQTSPLKVVFVTYSLSSFPSASISSAVRSSCLVGDRFNANNEKVMEFLLKQTAYCVDSRFL